MKRMATASAFAVGILAVSLTSVSSAANAAARTHWVTHQVVDGVPVVTVHDTSDSQTMVDLGQSFASAKITESAKVDASGHRHGESQGHMLVDPTRIRYMSARDQLVALGASPDILAQFSDFDQAPTASFPSAAQHVQLAPMSLTPIGTPICVHQYVDGSKISGYGCSTEYYSGSSSTADWLLAKYKDTAQSNDTSWWFPDRIDKLEWDDDESAGTVYDWDPYGPVNENNCSTITVTAQSPYGSISETSNQCPTLSGYDNTDTSAGAIWKGQENGTTSVGLIGDLSWHVRRGGSRSYWINWSIGW